MNKRLLETGKSLLIVLLACSALYLTARTQLGRGLLSHQSQNTSWQKETSIGPQAELARPARMAATLSVGDEIARYGVQYDPAACDNRFQLTARPLMEALSCAQTPQPIARTGWETALNAAPGIYFDLQGEVPLQVLSAWLGAEGCALEGTVRRLVLSASGDGVELYYQEAGAYYVCAAPMVTQSQLEEALSGLTGNQAQFAFEEDSYAALDPDTLILPQTPSLPACTALNPLENQGEGSALLNSQLSALTFSPDTNHIYTTSGTQAIRSGNDTLRLDQNGTMTYHALAGESSRYRLSGRLAEQVEECRALAQDTVGALCGDARLYLQSIRQTDQGTAVEFGYLLHGAQVQLGSESYAAQFVIEGDQLTQFTLHYRTYQSLPEQALVLPEVQAAAALQALGRSGQELCLVYFDSGSERLSPAWYTEGGGRV